MTGLFLLGGILLLLLALLDSQRSVRLSDHPEREWLGYQQDYPEPDLVMLRVSFHRVCYRRTRDFLKVFVESYHKLFDIIVRDIVVGSQVSLIYVRQFLANLLFGRGILHG